VPPIVRASVRKISFGLFHVFFPDNCRLCEAPLTEVSRVPVCRPCITKPEPLQAEYYCAACRSPFVNEFPLDEQGLCGLCRRGLNGFDAAYSFGFYEGALGELVQLFKYGKVTTLARPLGEMLTRALPRNQRFDVVVPMPMHWRRRWERGFNQADLLARELGRRSGLPVRQLVNRGTATPPQAGLTSAKRRANVAAAFQIPNPARVKNQRVLLIDDVLTTGATAGACARALKKAGAHSVTVLTVARADRRLWTEPLGAKAKTFSFQTAGSLANGKSRSLA
jgi:competence protein ComFC